ncbi:hypothetical protein [Nostoc sp.]
MKINRHGRAKVLTQQEIQLMFSHGLENDRDRSNGLPYAFNSPSFTLGSRSSEFKG